MNCQIIINVYSNGGIYLMYDIFKYNLVYKNWAVNKVGLLTFPQWKEQQLFQIHLYHKQYDQHHLKNSHENLNSKKYDIRKNNYYKCWKGIQLHDSTWFVYIKLRRIELR